MRELKKGSLSLLLLQLLYVQPSYGYELCERMRQRSDGVLTFEEGAIYPVLHEFERGGLVESYWEDAASTADRRGPRRRFYCLTEKGMGALQASLADWQAFTGAVSQVLGLPDGATALSQHYS